MGSLGGLGSLVHLGAPLGVSGDLDERIVFELFAHHLALFAGGSKFGRELAFSLLLFGLCQRCATSDTNTTAPDELRVAGADGGGDGDVDAHADGDGNRPSQAKPSGDGDADGDGQWDGNKPGQAMQRGVGPQRRSTLPTSFFSSFLSLDAVLVPGPAGDASSTEEEEEVAEEDGEA